MAKGNIAADIRQGDIKREVRVRKRLVQEDIMAETM